MGDGWFDPSQWRSSFVACSVCVEFSFLGSLMLRWFIDNLFAHMTEPPEREVGHCVTRQLVAEIERLQRREADMVSALRWARVYASASCDPPGLMLVSIIDRALEPEEL